LNLVFSEPFVIFVAVAVVVVVAAAVCSILKLF
jgi:hypothetical protein